MHYDATNIMENIIRRLITFVIVAVMIVPVFHTVCSAQDSQTEEIPVPDTLKSMIRLWSHYRSIGRQDSVIISAIPIYEYFISRQDTIGVRLSGLPMAQALILSGAEYDSTKQFMSSLLPYFPDGPDSKTASMYWTILGHYNLKYGLDYAASLQCYLKALDLARSKGNLNSQITMLYNIVNIFYTCSDVRGKEYAMEALKLSDSDSVNIFNKTAACIAAAQTYCISAEKDSALIMLGKARDMAYTFEIEYFYPIIHLYYGDCYTMVGDYAAAEIHYKRALEYSSDTEPSTVSLIYLNYGKVCEKAGRADEAADLYMQGISISSGSHNLEFREKLLKRLSILLYDTGRKDLAAHYFRQYMSFIDSISLENKEQSLFDMLLSYEKVQHQYAIARRDLALSENRQRLLTTVSVCIILLVLCIFFYILYARQRKQYIDAAIRYGEYSRKLSVGSRQEVSVSSDNHERSMMSVLYSRLERLMQEGAYRQKDLSLETIAGMLGSNRTYVSNTINKMSGMTFYSYLDSYRIKEAIRRLSDTPYAQTVSLKVLAADIGYNSPQVFHRAFKKETGTTPSIYRQEILKHSNKRP